MSWSEEELAVLKQAYASGVLRVRHDGREVEYDSGDALYARIQKLERAAGNGASSVASTYSYGVGSFSRN